MIQRFSGKHLIIIMSMLVLFLLSSFSVLAQDTNFCEGSDEIAYGDSERGQIDDDLVFASFCFDGDKGDELVITVETISGDLIPAVGIADPFVEDVMVEDTARNSSDIAEITFTLPDDGQYLILISREDFSDGDTEGRFEVTLTLENAGTSSSGGDGDSFCDTMGEDIEYGDSVSGDISNEEPFVVYCFEGEEGDFITVTMDVTSGDLEPTLALSDPYISDIMAQDNNSRGRDTVTIEFELEEDGLYMITATRVSLDEGDTEGRFSLDLDAEGGSNNSTSSGDTCDDMPLKLLSHYQWGIPGSDPEEPLLAYNIGCTGFMVSTIVGRSLVVEYQVSRNGELSFEVGDSTYTTISVDDEEWVLEVSNGDTLTLERLQDSDCDEEPLSELIHGAWELSDDDLTLDFGCNGIVLITFEGETSASTYEFSRGDIIIALGDDDLVFADAEIDRGELTVTNESSGAALTFENTLGN